MMKKRVVQKERWVCDVCRIATFDDYQEACRHEETCAGGKEEEENIETIMQMHPVETLEQTVGDKTRRRENDQDCTMDDDDDDSSVVMVTEENDHVKK
jgi:predicted HD phosphohydrolase